MTSDRAADCLRELIDARSGGAAAPPLADVWAAVLEWTAIPVDGIAGHDADLIWLETMLSTNAAEGEQPRFTVVMTRQLQHPAGDPVHHGAMQQILVTVAYDPLPAFAELIEVDDSGVGFGQEIWGRAGRPVPKWTAAVESDAVFSTALLHPPRALEVSQGVL